jgi:hypothetical protein
VTASVTPTWLSSSPTWTSSFPQCSRRSGPRRAGEQLARARMEWTAARATEIWFFANAANVASLRLH